MKTLKIRINGNVQGVFFRKFIKDKADELNIRGFARNLENGDVEIVAEGRDEIVNEMLKHCHHGPQHADVKKVYYEEIKHQGFKDFKILKL